MSILVDVKKYLALEEAPKQVQDYLSVAVTDHAYLPKTEDITSDWVAYIAAPAFKLIRENLRHDVEAFASIGTGSGIDVLTGIELLGAKRVGFTDLQKSVVDAAAENIRKNLKNADSIELEFGAGDLLQPLENGKHRYDVIYENLPNVPLTDNTKIEDKRNSGHYLEKRAERNANYNAETDKVRNILRRELEWMHATPCARSGKAKYRKQAFWELKDRAEQAYTVRQISMEALEGATRLGTKIIDCYDVGFAYGGSEAAGGFSDREHFAASGTKSQRSGALIRDFSYKFQRYDRIGVVGRNGIGKSTFIDLLTGTLEPTAGRIERGESLRIGYYRQSGMQFDEGQTVLETIRNTSLLEQFLFPHDMWNNPIARLSGGERRRLYLLTILMQQPNLLILDEPTNDLDIVTLNILEEYLLDFKGTLIVVSHDRHFLDRVTGHLLIFCGDGRIKDFVGGYTEYRTFIKDYESEQRKLMKKMPGQAGHDGERAAAGGFSGREHFSASGTKNRSSGAPRTEVWSSGAPRTEVRSSGAPAKKRLSYKEQREFEQIESQLEQLNAEKEAIEALLSRPDAPYDQIRSAAERYESLKQEIDEKENRWLELSL